MSNTKTLERTEEAIYLKRCPENRQCRGQLLAQAFLPAVQGPDGESVDGGVQIDLLLCAESGGLYLRTEETTYMLEASDLMAAVVRAEGFVPRLPDER